jgi:hypothetical protein
LVPYFFMKYPFSRLGKTMRSKFGKFSPKKIHGLECAQDKDVSERSNHNKWLFFIGPCGGNEMISHLRWGQGKKSTLYIGSENISRGPNRGYEWTCSYVMFQRQDVKIPPLQTLWLLVLWLLVSSLHLLSHVQLYEQPSLSALSFLHDHSADVQPCCWPQVWSDDDA